MTGEQIIYAMEHCKDNCKNCVASINGHSCKEYQKRYEEVSKEQHKKFGKILESIK